MLYRKATPEELERVKVAEPVKADRHKPGYMAEYMRKQRAKKKAAPKATP